MGIGEGGGLNSRDSHGHDNAEQSLDGGGDGDGFAADFGGGNFAEDDEADGADGKIVAELGRRMLVS